MSEFQLSDGSCLELQSTANRQQIPLLIYSVWQNPVFVGQMVKAGAYGMISKTATREELLSTLRKVAQGKKTWQRKDTRVVTGALNAARVETHIDFPLTNRELQVLTELSKGQTNRAIADRLDISHETVKEHVQNVLLKLGVNDRTQAAVQAVRRGLI